MYNRARQALLETEEELKNKRAKKLALAKTTGKTDDKSNNDEDENKEEEDM